MKSEKLKGIDLQYITTEDLLRWGIQNFSHRKIFLKNIERIINLQKNEKKSSNIDDTSNKNNNNDNKQCDPNSDVCKTDL